MGEKYFSEVPGFEKFFIEVSDAWTVKEMKALADSDEDGYFDIFHAKVESMFLADVDGKEFTNPRELSRDDVENFDVAVAGFLGSILPIHVRKRRNLGGLNVRQSSLSKDGQNSPKSK